MVEMQEDCHMINRSIECDLSALINLRKGRDVEYIKSTEKTL